MRDESRFAASDTDVSHDSKCHAGVGASSRAELKIHNSRGQGGKAKIQRHLRIQLGAERPAPEIYSGLKAAFDL